ncbi:hypothetical protein ACWV32_000983, partial [Escherichia coli]
HQDGPGDDQLTLAAALRAQPIPRKTSTAVAPALRYCSQPRQKSGAIGLRAGESCIRCLLWFCENQEREKRKT